MEGRTNAAPLLEHSQIMGKLQDKKQADHHQQKEVDGKRIVFSVIFFTHKNGFGQGAGNNDNTKKQVLQACEQLVNKQSPFLTPSSNGSG